jgi:hypothetical protein
MKKIFVYILLLVAFNQSTAQTYEETQRQKETKAYNDAYLDALRHNSNNTNNSNGGVDAKAAQELADLFNARAGRETSAQKEERLKKEKEAYAVYAQKQAIEHQHMVDHYKDEDARRNAIFLPLKKMYQDAGFPDFEASYLADGHVVGSLSADQRKTLYAFGENQLNYRAKIAFEEFNKKVNTADFAELFSLLSDFKIASWSCLLAMEKLEKRFPDKKLIFEPLALLYTASFWGTASEDKSGLYYNAIGNIRNTMLDKFKVWLDKYPQAALKIISDANPEYNPLKIWAVASYKKGNYNEAIKYTVLSLKSNYRGRNLSLSKNAIRELWEITADLTNKKLKLFTAEDIREIAKSHQVPARTIVEWLCDVETDRIATARLYDGKYYFSISFNYIDRGYAQILKILGEAGDGDALSTYATGVAFGRQKESPKKALEMWQTAADKGSAWAAYNLVAATDWGFKWYSKKDLAAAGEKWKSLKPATEDDKLVYAQKDAEVRKMLGQ